MVRYILFLVYCFISVSAFCQKFDAYKYVYISDTYSQHEKVHFEMYGSDAVLSGESYLRYKFGRKGFEVLPDNIHLWPEEAYEHIELILWCQPYYDIDKIVSIRLMNSNGTNVHEVASPILIKNKYNFGTIYKHCFESIDSISYFYEKDKAIQLDLSNVVKSGEDVSSLLSYFDSTDLDELEGIYISETSESIPYYKLAIKEAEEGYQVIILENQFSSWKVGDIKAFIQSPKEDSTYKVKWYSSTGLECPMISRIMDNGDLMIERENCNNSMNPKMRLLKIYPYD